MNTPKNVDVSLVTIAEPVLQKYPNPSRCMIHFEVDPEIGSFRIDNIQGRYFSLGEAVAAFKYDTLLNTPVTRSTHYSLALMNTEIGTARFEGGNWFDVVHNTSFFTYNPGAAEQHKFKANRIMKIHFLEIQPDYLNSFLLNMDVDKNSPLGDIREKMMRNEFVGKPGYVLPAFQQVISGIFNCPLSGPMGNLMLEGGLQQLLALQFAVLGGTAPKAETIRSRDKDVMHALREYLNTSFEEDHSLLTLSRKFGINQNKLKTQFRELFGTSVIAYVFDLKMEHSRKMLIDNGMNVNEVASMVGYRNPNHFTTAFKRKYGVSPSKIKR